MKDTTSFSTWYGGSMKIFLATLFVATLLHETFALILPNGKNFENKYSVNPQDNSNIDSKLHVYDPKEECNRRGFLLTLPALYAGSQLFSQKVWAEEGSVTVATEERTRSFVDRSFRFRIEYPANWLISKRTKVTFQGGIGGIITPNGGYSSAGTIFVAGNYQTGVTVGVSYTDVRKMLEDAGYDSSGPLETIANVGRPKGVADLLVRQRDGDPKEPSPVSQVVDARMGATSDVMDFTVKTIIKIAGTGLAPRIEDINLQTKPTSYRRTCARAIIKDGIMLTAWASALESQWGEEGQRLENVIQSFECSDKYALSPVIGGYSADSVV